MSDEIIQSFFSLMFALLRQMWKTVFHFRFLPSAFAYGIFLHSFELISPLSQFNSFLFGFIFENINFILYKEEEHIILEC